MTVSRLRDIPGIGVDAIGDAANAAADPDLLRLDNLGTGIGRRLTPGELSRLLFDRARVAATPGDRLGTQRPPVLRIVFANEPVERLATPGERFRAAIG